MVMKKKKIETHLQCESIVANNQASTLALFPARMREISSPLLKAWLKRRRDWKVETNGNHDKNAIGAKMTIPIPAS